MSSEESRKVVHFDMFVYHFPHSIHVNLYLCNSIYEKTECCTLKKNNIVLYIQFNNFVTIRHLYISHIT